MPQRCHRPWGRQIRIAVALATVVILLVLGGCSRSTPPQTQTGPAVPEAFTAEPAASAPEREHRRTDAGGRAELYSARHDLEIDVTIADESGDPLEDLRVDWYDDGIQFIAFVADDAGERVPLVYMGPSEALDGGRVSQPAAARYRLRPTFACTPAGLGAGPALIRPCQHQLLERSPGAWSSLTEESVVQLGKLTGVMEGTALQLTGSMFTLASGASGLLELAGTVTKDFDFSHYAPEEVLTEGIYLGTWSWGDVRAGLDVGAATVFVMSGGVLTKPAVIMKLGSLGITGVDILDDIAGECLGTEIDLVGSKWDVYAPLQVSAAGIALTATGELKIGTPTMIVCRPHVEGQAERALPPIEGVLVALEDNPDYSEPRVWIEGIQTGDIVVEAGSVPVNSPEQLQEVGCTIGGQGGVCLDNPNAGETWELESACFDVLIIRGDRAIWHTTVFRACDNYRRSAEVVTLTDAQAAQVRQARNAPHSVEFSWDFPMAGAPAGPAPSDEPEPLSGSLDPFPKTLAELRQNPRAMAAAQAVADGSNGYQKLEAYGEKTMEGWDAELQLERGPFVELLVLAGWQNGYRQDGSTALLRRTDSGYRFLLGLQDAPSAEDLTEAGITKDEYRRWLYDPETGWWPYEDEAPVAP